MQKAVAVGVSEQLCNKPATVLKSYIDPKLFNAWRKSAGMETV